MRDFKGMKRQRGRNRGGGNSGGGQKPTHNVNRAFDSNGPDGVKVRGAAQHVFEKYQQLARDATSAGDRVLGENYLQHAEHYFRLIRAVSPNKPASEIIGRDTFASGYDIDFEDESGRDAEPAEATETAQVEGEGGGEQPRAEHRDNNRQDRQDGQPREARNEWRRDREPRQEAPRQEGNREFRNDRPNRNRDRDRDRAERNDYAPAAEAEAAPPAVAAPQDDFQLRSQDGGLSPAPAFLQPRAETRPEAEADGEPKRAPRPRRRRAPRGFEGGDEDAAPPAETEDA